MHLRGADFHGWQTTSVLVEHVRRLVADGAPFVYAYYPGVDEVAHAYGLHGPYYAGGARRDRPDSSARVRDALPADTALLVTADHGQVQVGPEAWLGLRRARRRWSTPTPATAASATCTRAHGAAAEPVRGRVGARGEDAWVFAREQLLDEGWLGPDPPSATYAGASATSCSRRAHRVGFIDPDDAREAQLRVRPRILTPAEMLGAAGRRARGTSTSERPTR